MMKCCPEHKSSGTTETPEEGIRNLGCRSNKTKCDVNRDESFEGFPGCCYLTFSLLLRFFCGDKMAKQCGLAKKGKIRPTRNIYIELDCKINSLKSQLENLPNLDQKSCDCGGIELMDRIENLKCKIQDMLSMVQQEIQKQKQYNCNKNQDLKINKIMRKIETIENELCKLDASIKCTRQMKKKSKKKNNQSRKWKYFRGKEILIGIDKPLDKLQKPGENHSEMTDLCGTNTQSEKLMKPGKNNSEMADFCITKKQLDKSMKPGKNHSEMTDFCGTNKQFDKSRKLGKNNSEMTDFCGTNKQFDKSRKPGKNNSEMTDFCGTNKQWDKLIKPGKNHSEMTDFCITKKQFDKSRKPGKNHSEMTDFYGTNKFFDKPLKLRKNRSEMSDFCRTYKQLKKLQKPRKKLTEMRDFYGTDKQLKKLQKPRKNLSEMTDFYDDILFPSMACKRRELRMKLCPNLMETLNKTYCSNGNHKSACNDKMNENCSCQKRNDLVNVEERNKYCPMSGHRGNNCDCKHEYSEDSIEINSHCRTASIYGRKGNYDTDWKDEFDIRGNDNYCECDNNFCDTGCGEYMDKGNCSPKEECPRNTNSSRKECKGLATKYTDAVEDSTSSEFNQKETTVINIRKNDDYCDNNGDYYEDDIDNWCDTACSEYRDKFNYPTSDSDRIEETYDPCPNFKIPKSKCIAGPLNKRGVKRKNSSRSMGWGGSPNFKKTKKTLSDDELKEPNRNKNTYYRHQCTIQKSKFTKRNEPLLNSGNSSDTEIELAPKHGIDEIEDSQSSGLDSETPAWEPALNQDKCNSDNSEETENQGLCGICKTLNLKGSSSDSCLLVINRPVNSHRNRDLKIIYEKLLEMGEKIDREVCPMDQERCCPGQGKNDRIIPEKQNVKATHSSCSCRETRREKNRKTRPTVSFKSCSRVTLPRRGSSISRDGIEGNQLPKSSCCSNHKCSNRNSGCKHRRLCRKHSQARKCNEGGKRCTKSLSKCSQALMTPDKCGMKPNNTHCSHNTGCQSRKLCRKHSQVSREGDLARKCNEEGKGCMKSLSKCSQSLKTPGKCELMPRDTHYSHTTGCKSRKLCRKHSQVSKEGDSASNFNEEEKRLIKLLSKCSQALRMPEKSELMSSDTGSPQDTGNHKSLEGRPNCPCRCKKLWDCKCMHDLPFRKTDKALRESCSIIHGPCSNHSSIKRFHSQCELPHTKSQKDDTEHQCKQCSRLKEKCNSKSNFPGSNSVHTKRPVKSRSPGGKAKSLKSKGTSYDSFLLDPTLNCPEGIPFRKKIYRQFCSDSEIRKALERTLIDSGKRNSYTTTVKEVIQRLGKGDVCIEVNYNNQSTSMTGLTKRYTHVDLSNLPSPKNWFKYVQGDAPCVANLCPKRCQSVQTHKPSGKVSDKCKELWKNLNNSYNHNIYHPCQEDSDPSSKLNIWCTERPKLIGYNFKDPLNIRLSEPKLKEINDLKTDFTSKSQNDSIFKSSKYNLYHGRYLPLHEVYHEPTRITANKSNRSSIIDRNKFFLKPVEAPHCNWFKRQSS